LEAFGNCTEEGQRRGIRMTGYQSKKAMAQERLDILNNPGPDAGARVDELEALMAEDTDTIYEHEVVTTVRITVRSLSPYLDKSAFLEDYAYLTEFSLFTESDDYPRIVATSVVDDEVEYFDKEINDE
jgi:hypothetical protein